MNIRAEWEALLLDESHVGVRVKVYLDSYSLHIQSSRNAVNVSVGDNFQSSDTPSVDIDDNTNIHSSLLATTEHVLNLAGGQQKSFPVQVQYVFRGTYFQRDIDTVECGGMIDLARESEVGRYADTRAGSGDREAAAGGISGGKLHARLGKRL